MAFYEWSQNNSGGGFDKDDNLDHWVFIEADNKRFAECIAEDIGIYYDGVDKGMDCECCGDRWYSPDEVVLNEKYPTIEEYAKWLNKNYGWKGLGVIIHYKDGTKARFTKEG